MAMAEQNPTRAHFYSFPDPALQYWRFWILLAWNDLRRRYRRSLLGPLWALVGNAAFILAISYVYGEIFSVDIYAYTPYLACGFITWQLIQGLIAEGASTFLSSESMIKSYTLPLTVYAWRTVVRNLFVFAINAVLLIIVIGALVGELAMAAWVLPASLIIIFVNGYFASLLLGALSTRNRDLPELINSVLRLAFFVTPILWTPDQVGARGTLADINPLTHFIEIVRAPLLGEWPRALSWMIVGGVTLANAAAGLAAYVAWRRKIVFWLG
ncbi:MAG: ABC transporter permease [Pseudomonadota bacterium]